MVDKRIKVIGLVFIYLATIITANFSSYYFGAWVSIINALVFIGLDLTLRDRLHELWHNNKLWAKMFLLILAGSGITYLINSHAYTIALAGSISFFAASLVDTVIYHLLKEKSFMLKCNGSNLMSSLVDSVLFPTIAFGAFMPVIIIGQFIAKASGGFFYSLMLKRVRA